MTDHVTPEPSWQEIAIALKEDRDSLAAQLEEAREEIRLREESQIPMIPRAAHERLIAAEERERVLREALTATYECRFFGCKDFPTSLVRDALADTAPQEKEEP